MRVIPVAVWGSGLLAPGKEPNYENFKKVIVADVEFLHPHTLIHESTFIYCVAIAHLI